MKKFPVWLVIAFLSFAVGVTTVIFWSIPSEIVQPSQFCSSLNFPGKSVSGDSLSPEVRSIYESQDVLYSHRPEFYSAFQEEIFESRAFFDGKDFPETANADEIYRFFWLRTFHNPVVIRVYRMNDDKYIVAKQTDGRGGYSAGKLIYNKTRKLSDAEWCNFVNLLDQADFWNKKKIDVSSLAHDGAMWIIEGANEKRYYVAGEQSPDTGKFRDACIYLMKISGLGIDEKAEDFY